MQYRRLGESELHLSELGLGTMTFGQQTALEDAHQQLDYAVDQGINWIDMAEMYPVPVRAETQGRTETFVGQWLAQQPRDRVVIATKIAGPSRRMDWLRGGPLAIDRSNIKQAVHDSLKRLRTDYIDLYQIHWPDRYVPLFGQAAFDPKQMRDHVAIAEQLSAFAELIQAGKIRYLGLSNETPWGIAQFCAIARQFNLPQVVSLQNAYNLLNRVFDWAWAEACYHENIGLLAYSPLAFGCLTGKYLDASPDTARMTMFPGFGQRYNKPNVAAAVRDYVAIAHRHHLSPTALALAFVRQRWCVTSTIVGASTFEQLQENLASLSVSLDAEVLAEIEQVHVRYPNPAP